MVSLTSPAPKCWTRGIPMKMLTPQMDLQSDTQIALTSPKIPRLEMRLFIDSYKTKLLRFW